MPILLDRGAHSTDLLPGVECIRTDAIEGLVEPQADGITIGLINNMPDPALAATERQFLQLLEASSQGAVVRMKLYSLPEVPRGEWGRQHISEHYSDVSSLWDSELDGLIVTGTEPRAPDLTNEPYWRSMVDVIDWAQHHTSSTIWSCLAAHAAVLHLDGIQRRPLDEKRFGVFEHAKAMKHRLLEGVPSEVRTPHSRWNDLPVESLGACGYRILTKSPDAGVDLFVQDRRSLFVFFQGHPEYDAHSLFLEYRRDIGRYLRRERDTYPPMPRGYFDEESKALFDDLHRRALRRRDETLLESIPTDLVVGKLERTWRPSATAIYRNWFALLSERKARNEGRGGGRRTRAALRRPI